MQSWSVRLPFLLYHFCPELYLVSKKALLRECLTHVHQDIVTSWTEWRSGKRLLVLESLAETTIIHTDPD